jgi:hypothetical protein
MESHREFQQLQMLNFYKFYYEIKKLMEDITKKNTKFSFIFLSYDTQTQQMANGITAFLETQDVYFNSFGPRGREVWGRRTFLSE